MAALTVSSGRSSLAADLRLSQCDTIDHPITPLLAYVCCENLKAEALNFIAGGFYFVRKSDLYQRTVNAVCCSLR